MAFKETIIIPVIISIVELIKSIGISRKYSAIIAIAVGILIGVFYVMPGDLKNGLFKGVVYGLMSSGLYSGTKNAVEGLRGHIRQNARDMEI